MTSRTHTAHSRTLELIEQAQTLLYAAAQESCPLQGWLEQWRQIGDHADATQQLWHTLNDSPPPSGHDNDLLTP